VAVNAPQSTAPVVRRIRPPSALCRCRSTDRREQLDVRRHECIVPVLPV